MLRNVACVALAAAFVAAAGVARAADGFELCNRTKLPVRYAKAINDKAEEADKNAIVSEGWFKLDAGACEVLYPGKLEFRYYLIYAEANARGSKRRWTGDRSVCVESRSFKITRDVCPPSRNNRMFIQVDTGDSENFTYELK